MKLSEMRDLLATNELRLTKSLGQNFLHDQNQLQRIVAAAELSKQDQVLEIGPGLGPLTELLLAQAGTVLAIEKDARLVKLLEERYQVQATALAPEHNFASKEQRQPEQGLRLVQADALEYLRQGTLDWTDWKVVANLPYSVASPILVELAQGSGGPERIVVTLQIEVAKRLAAEAGTPDYGVLTLLVQLGYEPRGWFKIPASCFFPEPEVDSACISLVRRSPPLLPASSINTFRRIVKRSFSQRRKMMVKLLKADWPVSALVQAFTQLGLSLQARAQHLDLQQFVRLTQFLEANSTTREDPQTMSEEIFDVVNERDEVIGRNTRSEVHRLGLMHRAVHVLVFNSRGQVFLQKRSLSKDRQPGLWDSSASGHLDSGETYDACAVREVREEIGLTLKEPPLRLFKLAASPETDQEHVWIYRSEAEGPFTLHPEEIERGDWFSPEEVTRWMAGRPQEFASALLVIWKRLFPLDGYSVGHA